MYVVTNERVCHSTQDNFFKKSVTVNLSRIYRNFEAHTYLTDTEQGTKRKQLDDLNAGLHHTEFEKNRRCFYIII